MDAHNAQQWKQLMTRHMLALIWQKSDDDDHDFEHLTVLLELHTSIDIGEVSDLYISLKAIHDAKAAEFDNMSDQQKKDFTSKHQLVPDEEVDALHDSQRPMNQGRHPTCTAHAIAYTLAQLILLKYGHEFAPTQEKFLAYIMAKCGPWRRSYTGDLLQEIKTKICDDDTCWFATEKYRIRFTFTFLYFDDFQQFQEAMVDGHVMPVTVKMREDPDISKQGRHAVAALGSSRLNKTIQARNSWGRDNPLILVHGPDNYACSKCPVWIYGFGVYLRITNVKDNLGNNIGLPPILVECLNPELPPVAVKPEPGLVPVAVKAEPGLVPVPPEPALPPVAVKAEPGLVPVPPDPALLPVPPALPPVPPAPQVPVLKKARAPRRRNPSAFTNRLYVLRARAKALRNASATKCRMLFTAVNAAAKRMVPRPNTDGMQTLQVHKRKMCDVLDLHYTRVATTHASYREAQRKVRQLKQEHAHERETKRQKLAHEQETKRQNEAQGESDVDGDVFYDCMESFDAC